MPLQMAVRVTATEFPDDSMRGKTNPHPFSFVAAVPPQGVPCPPRLQLTLAIAQVGAPYTIGVPMKNVTESPVQRVAVSLLAKDGGNPTVHRIPFAPLSEKPPGPGNTASSSTRLKSCLPYIKSSPPPPQTATGLRLRRKTSGCSFREAVQAALAHIEYLSCALQYGAGNRHSLTASLQVYPILVWVVSAYVAAGGKRMTEAEWLAARWPATLSRADAPQTTHILRAG